MEPAKVQTIIEEEKLEWYSIKVISGKERKIEENIMYEASINKIENYIKKVFVPYEKVVQVKNNKKVIKE